MRRIAIIGGGVAGAAVAGELLRHGALDSIALSWLVGRRAPGRGVAYSSADDQHLLNVRAANMGLFADDPSALLRYAHEHGIAAQAKDFLPRSLFGDFAEHTVARLLRAHAAESCTIDLRSSEAVALRRRVGGGYTVRNEDGTELCADHVVLALGAPPPQALPEVTDRALASGRYAVDPWQLPRVVKAPQRVVVIGSGLSAVDAVLTASEQWPDAQIVIVSRHGRLPGAHRDEPGAPYVRQHELVETLQTRPDVAHWLRVLREAAHDSTDWRSVIDGLRPATQRLWQSLDAVQRGRFLRHLRWIWDVARHRMAPQVAETLELLRDAGRLEVFNGRVRSVDGTAPLQLIVRQRSDGALQALTADMVIQAVGFEPLTAETSHRLLRQIIADGELCIDALGLGLDCAADGTPFRADGKRAEGLHVIGSLLRGTLWECTALPEIRAAASRQADELRRTSNNVTRLPDPSRHIDMAIRQIGT